MAVLDTTTVDVVAPQSAEHTPVAGARAGLRTAALVQWLVVGSLLAYGVSQTAIKAAALFG